MRLRFSDHLLGVTEARRVALIPCFGDHGLPWQPPWYSVFLSVCYAFRAGCSGSSTSISCSIPLTTPRTPALPVRLQAYVCGGTTSRLCVLIFPQDEVAHATRLRSPRSHLTDASNPSVSCSGCRDFSLGLSRVRLKHMTWQSDAVERRRAFRVVKPAKSGEQPSFLEQLCASV